MLHLLIEPTVGTGDEAGFNHWSGPYENFVRKAMSRTWGKAVLKDSDDGDRMSFELKNSISDVAETKILFAIGQ